MTSDVSWDAALTKGKHHMMCGPAISVGFLQHSSSHLSVQKMSKSLFLCLSCCRRGTLFLLLNWGVGFFFRGADSIPILCSSFLSLVHKNRWLLHSDWWFRWLWYPYFTGFLARPPALLHSSDIVKLRDVFCLVSAWSLADTNPSREGHICSGIWSHFCLIDSPTKWTICFHKSNCFECCGKRKPKTVSNPASVYSIN